MKFNWLIFWASFWLTIAFGICVAVHTDTLDELLDDRFATVVNFGLLFTVFTHPKFWKKGE